MRIETVKPQKAGLSAQPIWSFVSWKSVASASMMSARMEKTIEVVTSARQLAAKSRPEFIESSL